MIKNVPYTRDSFEITKKTPYLNTAPNRAQRRNNRRGRDFSNKKGTQVVVTQIGPLTFMKYVKQVQNIFNKVTNKIVKRIVHNVER